jgi:hypothetical protein
MAAAFVVSFIPEGWLDPTQRLYAVGLGTLVLGTAVKMARDRGVLPASNVALVLPLVFLLSGCSMVVGKVDPIPVTITDHEETVVMVTCKIRGAAFAIGAGGTCSRTGTNEGGHLGADFTNMVSAIFNGLGRVTGAVFGGYAPPAPAIADPHDG